MNPEANIFSILMGVSGARGPLVPEDKPKGVLRVIAIGDSVTFGTGIPDSATWPRQLETQLVERLGRSVEVINTALPAIDLAQAELMLRIKWARYQPDAVAVMLTGNMVSLGWIRRDDPAEPPPNPYLDPSPPPEGIAAAVAKGARLLRRLALPGFLKINIEQLSYRVGLLDHQVDPQEPYGIMLAYGWKQPDLDPGMAEAAWGLTGRQVRTLSETTKSMGVQIVLGYSQARFAISDSPLDNLKAVPKERLTLDPVRKAEELCDRLSVPFADVRTPFREAEPDGTLYVLADYTHLNERGNAVVARVFADMLAPSLLEP